MLTICGLAIWAVIGGLTFVAGQPVYGPPGYGPPGYGGTFTVPVLVNTTCQVRGDICFDPASNATMCCNSYDVCTPSPYPLLDSNYYCTPPSTAIAVFAECDNTPLSCEAGAGCVPYDVKYAACVTLPTTNVPSIFSIPAPTRNATCGQRGDICAFADWQHCCQSSDFCVMDVSDPFGYCQAAFSPFVVLAGQRCGYVREWPNVCEPGTTCKADTDSTYAYFSCQPN